MIPNSVEIDYEESTSNSSYPSKTYYLDIGNQNILDSIDGMDAIKQAITKILLTDRYAYEIYDGYYGNELNTLIGKSYDYVIVEAPRMIKDSLMRDDRIIDVSNFKFESTSINSINIEFEVQSISGTIDFSWGVQI